MSLYHYKAKIEYNGAAYSGWQIQSQGEKTIQGELNRSLSSIANTHEVKTIGGGRTDAGVHALGQIVRIEMPLAITPDGLRKALATKLPSDIRCLEVWPCTAEFHPIFSAISKEYVFFFTNRREGPSVFQIDRIANCPFSLNIELIREACALFVGEHDFINFSTKGTPVVSTLRTVFECELITSSTGGFPDHLSPSCFMLRIRGNGFLKQMVRLIVGSLWEVGRGKISKDIIGKALEARQELRAGPVAPPEGLYLKEIFYP
jgi:tRNA pseudouridine38-40 synthase